MSRTSMTRTSALKEDDGCYLKTNRGEGLVSNILEGDVTVHRGPSPACGEEG
jgi:hypothetical protein